MLEKYSHVIFGFLKKTLWIRTELFKPLIIGMTLTLAKDLPTIEQKKPELVILLAKLLLAENSQVKAYTLQ